MPRNLTLLVAGVITSLAAWIASPQTTAGSSAGVRPKIAAAAPGVAPQKRKVRPRAPQWTAPNYANSAAGDQTAGDDPVVREAAAVALGRLNGSVVVADPKTGRVLTIVNQRLAYQGGFQPCSTVKLVIGVAALAEGIVERTTPVNISRRISLDMSEALAKSNNAYFAELGTRVGFDRVSFYARLFGLGERAGLGIEQEQPGRLPEAPPVRGGVGRMSSFGEGIRLTPLQLAAMVSAVANGGTLYYLQYPRDAEEAASFVPRVKRELEVAPWLAEIKPGMLGAVEFGTGKSAAYSPDEPILGKTGTCTDSSTPTHLGWFGSFNEVGANNVVVVVMLTGAGKVSGSVASMVAGKVYRRLSEQQYFSQERVLSPAVLLAERCCVR